MKQTAFVQGRLLAWHAVNKLRYVPGNEEFLLGCWASSPVAGCPAWQRFIHEAN